MAARMREMVSNFGDLDGKTDEMCKLQDLTKTRLDEGMEEINSKLKDADQEANKGLDDLYEKMSRNYKNWEEENVIIKDLIKGIKRKSDAMDVDADTGAEDAEAQPEKDPNAEEPMSDDEDKEKGYTGAMNHEGDMTTYQKESMIGWLVRNPQQGKNAMRKFDKKLMWTKGIALTYSEDRLSRLMFDAVVGNPQARKNGGKQLIREGSQALGWYPIGTLRDHVSDPDVWGDITDEMFWKIITETKNRKSGKSSYMIKNIRDTFFLIKARPRPKQAKNQGYYGGAPMSSAGGSAGGTDEEEEPKGWRHWSHGSRYQRDYYDHGKKEDAAAGTKGDGPTMKAPHLWAQEQELKKAKDAKDAKDAELAKEEATNAQAGNASSTMPAGSATSAVPGKAPMTWFIGQTTQDTFTEDFLPKTWRKVKPGDKCPWDERIAKCTRDEYEMSK